MTEEGPSLFQSPTQIALPLAGKAPRAAQRLVVGNANAQVIEALSDPQKWPFHVAVLTGPPRSGKSLIGRWLAGQECGARIAVIDDAHRVDETELFHRWNAVQQAAMRADGNGAEALLLIAGQGEGGWQIGLPDLASRLGGSMQLAITEPDDAMASDLLMALAQQRGLSLPEGAADYLVPRATRSFAALEALVEAIDRISLERQSPATMSVWRAALEALQGPEQQRLF
jgi:hypothetical protein